MKTQHHISSFKCNTCDNTCKSDKALKNHNTRKHKEENWRKNKDTNISLESAPRYSEMIQASEERLNEYASTFQET